MDLVPHIYHETQENGSMLCAQHALNNLLQNPLFTPQDLASLGQHLDELESNITEAKGFRESENYDDSGFFSVGVMEEALRVFGLRLVRWGGEELSAVRQTPEVMPAFVLNHELHWFAIRRFALPSRFYNLDSTHPAPTWISSMYLSLTLKHASEQGYSIFAVLPTDPNKPLDGGISGEESVFPQSNADRKARSLGEVTGRSGAGAAGIAQVGARWPTGAGHSLAGPSGSFASGSGSSSGWASATDNSFQNGASSSTTVDRKGKRRPFDEDDDDLQFMDSATSPSESVESESERRRLRRKVENVEEGMRGVGIGDADEEEMIRIAMEESLKSFAEGGGGEVSGDSGVGGSGRSVEGMQEEEDDNPSVEELRRRRLARFGG